MAQAKAIFEGGIKMKRHFIKDALLGVAVGEAMGVPVEFRSRSSLALDPVIGVRGFGTHGQPAGTWSDDSSLTFCLAEMLCGAYDLHDLARRFINWREYGYWTAHGDVFDIGIGTAEAISKLESGVDPLLAGGAGEMSNGNGSLMRILPLLFHIDKMDIADRFRITKEISSLTHRHMRSIISCFLYLEFAKLLCNGEQKQVAYRHFCVETSKWLANAGLADKIELSNFDRILHGWIPGARVETIKSSGYVIHSLEAALWCLLTTENFQNAVLEAVNLGEDTDTTAAITGGLAGLTYGWDTIPSDWLGCLARKGDIEELGERLRLKKG